MWAERRAVERPLHKGAQQAVEDEVRRFTLALALLLQAKLEAFRERADVVLSNHVERARLSLSQDDRRGTLRQLAVVAGAALFGAAASGSENEVGGPKRTGFLTVYVVVGVVSLTLVLVGVLRRR